MPENANLGAAAGLGASALWVATSLLFNGASRRLGATRTNMLRLLVALSLHAVTFWIVAKAFAPAMRWEQVVALALSGAIGLAVSDQARMLALLRLGPRLTLLVGTLEPVFGVLFALLLFHETVPWPVAAGVAMVVGGVAWTVLERRIAHEHHAPTGSPAWRWGLVFAVIAAATQVTGFALSKYAMEFPLRFDESRMGAQPATLVRMFFGAAALAPFMLIWGRSGGGRAGKSVPGVQVPGEARQGVLMAVIGATSGPYFGVWCSLVALSMAPMAVAQTMLSMAPVFVLPVVVLLFKERVSPRAWLGAVVAVGGAGVVAFGREIANVV